MTGGSEFFGTTRESIARVGTVLGKAIEGIAGERKCKLKPHRSQGICRC
jgi:hypothetical protein